jgi:CheY-like chemotaxis protein
VFVDPTQLELALLNLIFNARDAMPGGGNITVSAALSNDLRSETSQDCPFVRIDVADDGPGMSEDVRARATEPYFTTKSVGSGSGLGLAQVASFVKQSGGKLQVESELGKGTCISMSLPGCVLLPTASGPADADTTTTKSLRILMVEDDLLVSSVVVPALEGAGHSVSLCVTADEAVTLLTRMSEFDVLFTDVVMPGKMTGMDLAQWCQQNIPSIGVVVATGYTTQRSDGQVQLLKKPYELAELQAALRGAASPKANATFV